MAWFIPILVNEIILKFGLPVVAFHFNTIFGAKSHCRCATRDGIVMLPNQSRRLIKCGKRNLSQLKVPDAFQESLMLGERRGGNLIVCHFLASPTKVMVAPEGIKNRFQKSLFKTSYFSLGGQNLRIFRYMGKKRKTNILHYLVSRVHISKTQ